MSTRMQQSFWQQAGILGLLILAIGLSVPPFRFLIEQSMFVQMVIQMPLLFIAGALLNRLSISKNITNIFGYWNVFGLTGFMLAQNILIYWMLPISIDRAVIMPLVDVAKVLTMILAGFFVGDALNKSPAALQLFFIGYFVAMMIWLGMYFIYTDARLCNAYSLNSQYWTGYGLCAISVMVAAYWSYRVLKNSKQT
jgi:hypothetical protein